MTYYFYQDSCFVITINSIEQDSNKKERQEKPYFKT